MTSKMTIVMRNATPNREPHYPRTWFLHKLDRNVKVHVGHDGDSKPHIVDKSAA
jgi:hypothetical protein